MALETRTKLCVTAEFSGKDFFCLKNWENGPKTGFLKFIEKNITSFHRICAIMKIYNICCCSCANPIIGKILFSEIWAKMFSANQITGFFNQSYLQIKSMK